MVVRGKASFDVGVEIDYLNWKRIVVLQGEAPFVAEVEIDFLNWK